MDLLEPSEAGNTPEFSVSELSGALKKTVEGAFSRVRVRGELGRVVRAASGHIYVDLKDEKSVINCNIWKGVASKLSIVPEEGMEVIATGKLSTYAPQSKYNLIIDSLEIAGEGALMALLEKRKKALAAEGLFDPAKKRPLPYLPDRIGVITSRSGAVIRDILHRLSDRFPREVILWPVAVQGDKCAEEVKAAIAGFNALAMDDPHYPNVIIIARGGGSIEDLWGFNEEIVVRAAAASTIPIISAVGHETDTTLIDYVSDKRAPTPTAAAEMAVPVRNDLLAYIADLDARRLRSLGNIRSRASERLADLVRALPRADAILSTPRQRLDLAASRLVSGLERSSAKARQQYSGIASRLSPAGFAQAARLKTQQLSHIASRLLPVVNNHQAHARTRLDAGSRLLEALSYHRILDRGFAVIRDQAGDVLSSANAVSDADMVVIEQKDGRNLAQVKKG